MNEMIVDLPKKRQNNQGKLSWEEKAELCNRWKESGLNKSQFCKKHDLALPTFCEWCKRVWPKTEKQNLTKLTPVRIVSHQETETQVVVELLLPNQAVAKIRLPLSSIGSLIKELCYATTTIR
jgi:hypothetical protein